MSQDSIAAETARREAARALEAAGEQIALALREAQPQVEALGESLQQLAGALSRPGDAAGLDVSALAGVMRRAVTRLQFYDRMTQHLSHVQDYLARSADKIGNPEPTGGWTGVHQQLSDRLLSDTQRFHLGKSFAQGQLAATDPQSEERRKRATPGDVELF
ncbi:MAG: hypothetical protein WDO12_15050 [Pseudomonadota bacterium]